MNPAASGGKATRLIPTITETIRSSGGSPEIFVPDSRDKGARLLRGWVGECVERVIVVGGDGMVHLAVNELVESETILGLVPGGTGNDSATGLGLPSDTAAAVRAALSPARPVDLIRSGDRYACSVATLGFSVAVNVRAEAMSFPKGGAKYTIASLIEIPRLETHDLKLKIDGRSVELTGNLLAVANTPMFGGGMRIAPGADPTDGLLDIIVIGPASRRTFLRLLPTVFSGGHVRDPRVTVERGATVRIEGHGLQVRADGEEFGELPIELSIVRGAVMIAGIAKV